MQRRNSSNNSDRFRNSDGIQRVPLSGTVDPRIEDYKIPNANDWEDLRALRKAIMYEKYKQNQMGSNSIKRYNDSNGNGKPNNYYHDPNEGDFNYEQYLSKQQKHNENPLNSNNNRNPNRSTNNNNDNDRQDYNVNLRNRHNTAKDYSPFSGYPSIMELLSNQNPRTTNNNSNNNNSNDKSTDRSQYVQQLNQNYPNNNNSNNRSNKMKDERNYPNILSWPETSTGLANSTKNNNTQNHNYSGNDASLRKFEMSNANCNDNNNENRNHFNYNNGDSRGQTSLSHFYPSPPTNNNNNSRNGWPSNSSVDERRNFSLDSIHAGDFIPTRNQLLPPYPDMKQRNTCTTTTTNSNNNNKSDDWLSSIPQEYLHNFIKDTNISKSNYQALLDALNLDKNNSITNNNLLSSKRTATDDVNQKQQSSPPQRSFGLNKNPPRIPNSNNHNTKISDHNKGHLDYLLKSSHSMNSNPYPSTAMSSSFGKTQNIIPINNSNQNFASTLNFLTNQRNGKLTNNNNNSDNSSRDVNNNNHNKTNNNLTANSNSSKSMKLDIPITKNPHFPQHLSETHASFRNPMDLHKRFRTSSINQSTVDNNKYINSTTNIGNNKTNSMHSTQSAMNNIPIIPQVTESQASYQNPYAPRKLPMGYPDKNTNYFVRFSNSIRDSYNNDPSSRNCLLPPRPPESLTNRRNTQNNNNKHNNEYVMLDYLSQSSDSMMNRHGTNENHTLSTNNNNNNSRIGPTTVNNIQYNIHKDGEMREKMLRNNDILNNNNTDNNNTTENNRKDFEMHNHYNQQSNSQYTLNRSPYSRMNFNNQNHNTNIGNQGSAKSTQNNNSNNNNNNAATNPSNSNNNNSITHDKSRRKFPLPRLSKNNISNGSNLPSKVKKKTERNTNSKSSSSSFTKRCGDGDSRVTFASYSNDDGDEEEEKLKYYGRPRVYSRARTTTTERHRLESRTNDMRRSSTVMTSNPYSRQDYEYDPGPTRSSRFDTPLLNTPLRERMSFRTGSRTATAKSRSTRAPTTISTSSSSHPNNPRQLKSILKQPQVIFDRPMKIMLFCTKGIMTVPSPTDVIPNINSFSQPKDLISYNKNTMLPNSSDHRRNRFTVNMGGFLDEDIYFFTDKQRRKLIVEGRRPKRENINARRLIETVDLPYGLDPDNLRVARDYKGHLLFEEAWIF